MEAPERTPSELLARKLHLREKQNWGVGGKGGVNSRLATTEKKKNELEDTAIEILQNEKRQEGSTEHP